MTEILSHSALSFSFAAGVAAGFGFLSAGLAAVWATGDDVVLAGTFFVVEGGAVFLSETLATGFFRRFFELFELDGLGLLPTVEDDVGFLGTAVEFGFFAVVLEGG